MKIADARTLPPVAQEDLRRKGIAALRAGRSVTAVASLFGVSRQAVYNWQARYAADGAGGLAARQRGKRPAPKLNARQAARIRRLITNRHPEQWLLPFALWTREGVQQLITRQCGVVVSVRTVGRYLKAWGFTPQRPARKALEQNPAAVRRWLREEYPAVRVRAKRENAAVLWSDQMGVRSDQAGGRSYAPRGQTPRIPSTGQRFSCNQMSAVSNQGKLCFMVFRRRFRVPVFLEFLRRLVRQMRRKVFLIVDRHPVHRAARVKAWLAAHGEQMVLVFLPAYSPELNPDEYLNQDVKANAVATQRPRDAAELEASLRSYLRATQKRPELVRRYFQAEPVRYAAAV
jgi:transposase